MNIKKILCPIDFSKFNELANELASELAVASGATIVYLAVADQDASSHYDLAINRLSREAMEKLVEYCPTNSAVEFSHEVKVSSRTAKTIVDFADDNEIDLIVLATHGRSGLSRLLLGSVAEAVVRGAECPVLTVKPDFRATDAATKPEIKNQTKQVGSGS